MAQGVATNDPWTPLPPTGLIPGPEMEEDEDWELGSKKHIAVLGKSSEMDRENSMSDNGGLF